MKTLNAGDMMISNLKSSKIAAADSSHLLFFVACLVFSFSKSLRCPVRVKNNIMQNRWLIQSYDNEPKWKGWIIYKKKKKKYFLLWRSSSFAKRKILERYGYPCTSFTIRKQMFGDRLWTEGIFSAGVSGRSSIQSVVILQVAILLCYFRVHLGINRYQQ